MLFKKKRLAIATAVYWFLLAYILALLCWWFIALEKGNHHMTEYRLQLLKPNDPNYNARQTAILEEEKRHTAEWVEEGSTFLFLILLGALFVHREVRQQIRFQQQQQNFMMAVTHELKTPIAVVKLNLETLRKYRLDEDKQQQVIQATIQETDRLDTLANNILVASQLEGGGYARTKEVLDFSDLAEQSIRNYRYRFPGREWIARIQPDHTITGDPFLLHLLVNNLLENALKYSPKESAVTLTLTKENAHTLLTVKDNGPGIPDEEKKKIFGKFYRQRTGDHPSNKGYRPGSLFMP